MDNSVLGLKKKKLLLTELWLHVQLYAKSFIFIISFNAHVTLTLDKLSKFEDKATIPVQRGRICTEAFWLQNLSS